MSQIDKVEIMDFLISILKEHEKSLDSLIFRVETLLKNQDCYNKLKNSRQVERLPIKVTLKEWEHLCRKAQGAEFVCYDLICDEFIVQVNLGSNIYEYKEKIAIHKQELSDNRIIGSGINSENIKNLTIINGKLSIGLELKTKIRTTEKKHKLSYDLDREYTRNWLSTQLSVHEDIILYGGIHVYSIS